MKAKSYNPKIMNAVKFIRFVNRLLPKHWHLSKWFPRRVEPKEGACVYCQIAMGVHDIKAAFYKGGQFISVMSGEPLELVTFWRYAGA